MKTAYWIIAVMLTAGALILLVSLGRPPSVSQATDDFCADMSAYAQAVAELRAIDENSTVEELRAVGTAVQDSQQALQSSAAALTEARTAELQASHEQLQTTIQSIPNDTTLREAQATLRLATLNALADAVRTMTTTCQISLPEGATTLPQR